MRLRERWRLVSAVTAVLFIVVFAYAAWTYSAARSVERLLDEAEALDVAAIATGEESALESARLLVEQSDNKVDSLSGRLGPIQVAAATLGWLPWVGDQLRAPGQLTSRAEADLRATRRLISAADGLFELQELINDGGLAAAAGSDEVTELVRSLQEHADQSAVEVAEVRSEAARMEGVSLLGVFDSRISRVASLEEKLLAGGEVLAAAPSAIDAARDVGDSASELLALLGDAGDGFSVGGLSARLDQLAADSRVAADSMAVFETSVAQLLPNSDLANLVSDLSTSLDAVAELSEGLNVIGGSIVSAFAVLQESGKPLLSDGDALQGALSVLVTERESLGDAAKQANLALATISQLISTGKVDFLTEDLKDALVDQTASLVDAGELLSAGPSLFLDLIAPGSTKTYLVLGQTSDELRAAGGFTSSAWTLTFSNGALTGTEYIPVLEFDDPESLGSAPAPPEPLRHFMDTGALYLRDVGWDPDFASVGRLASELYRIGQAREIDGVISVTQWGIIRLVEAVGGLEVAGQYVSPDDVLRVIEERTDSEGTGFLQQLFVALLDSLQGDAPARTQFELLQAITEIVARKDLMLFSNDADEQRQIESVGLAGRFPLSGHDRLAVVDSNIGWSKSDRSIVRNARYMLDLTNIDRPAASLTLDYRNTGSEVGRDCDSHSSPTSDFKIYRISVNSCYWNLVRAYVATGSEVVVAPELPLPANSVPTVLGSQAAGTPTFSHDFDEHGDLFSGLLTVPPASDSGFTVKYELPASILEHVDAGFVYVLDLVAQPGARGRNVVVELLLPGGHSLASSSHVPVAIDESTLRFEFDLQSDEQLRLEINGTS